MVATDHDLAIAGDITGTSGIRRAETRNAARVARGLFTAANGPRDQPVTFRFTCLLKAISPDR